MPRTRQKEAVLTFVNGLRKHRRRDALPAPRVVIVVSAIFLPGYRGGGPIRSLAALMQLQLGTELRLLTGDRDLGMKAPYPDIKTHTWCSAAQGSVMYLPRGQASSLLHAWWEIMARRPDCIYLNSFFAPFSGLLPIVLWRIGLLGRTRLLVAPRGQFDGGALTLKSRRKFFALTIMRRMGVLKGVRWHAESGQEAVNIRRAVGKGSIVKVVTSFPNLPSRSNVPVRPHEPLRLVFISRVSPKKGLLVAIKALAHVRGPLRLDVYGLIDDATYGDECREAALALPDRAVVRFHGPIRHDAVAARLEAADIFVLPTLGENFGHAILEALAVGCPVVLGPDTPWSTDVEAGAGIIVDSKDPLKVAEAIQDLVAEDRASWMRRSDAAVAAALRHAQTASAQTEAWNKMFFD